MPDQQVDGLRAVRDELKGILETGWKTQDPRIFYGGSYAKGTMIRESFDLDLVVYFPHSKKFSVRAFYEGVERRLRDNGLNPARKNVALRLHYRSGFHVDVVPGRATDKSFTYANLYSAEDQIPKRTNVKLHVDNVRKSEHLDVIKLLKLWRQRKNVSISSFALDILALRALTASRNESLGNRLDDVLHYIRNTMLQIKLVDPANSNNVVSDSLSNEQRQSIRAEAERACRADSWDEVVW